MSFFIQLEQFKIISACATPLGHLDFSISNAIFIIFIGSFGLVDFPPSRNGE
jgi:hypothetical protein